MQRLILALNIISISFLTACANKDSILPQPEHDMKTVYETHMQGVGDGKLYDRRSSLRRPMHEGDVKLSEYVRSEKKVIESKFKMIPNPTMYMFVAPHLASQSEVPIPGYLTEFKMWEKEHYALPGEISDMRNGFGDR